MSFFHRVKRLLGMGGDEVECPSAGGEMISCQDALSFINEFIDGEVEGIPYDEVKAHFDVCQRCYPHLKLEESFRAALHQAAAADRPPEDLLQRVTDRLAEASSD